MKFYFTPLRSKTKIRNDITVNITKAGYMFFGKWSLINLGIDPNKSFLLRLYEDAARRTLGFKLSNDIDLIENKILKNIRLVKPFKTKTNSVYAQVGIKPFLNLLPNLYLPSNHLEVKKYKDSEIGEMWYITFPESSTK